MKKFKNIIYVTLLFSFFSMFLFSSNVLATDINDPELKAQYQELLNGGIIDPSLTYEVWANNYISGLNLTEQIREETEYEVRAASHDVIQVVEPAYTQMKAGDIFVTTDALVQGFTGHAAMAISSTAILNMPGSMPWVDSTTEILSYAQWKDKYDNIGTQTWIYRHSDSNMAQKAADWARRNYWNSYGGGVQNLKPEYLISTNLYSKDPSYCSKLVWQAYYNTTPSSVRVPFTKVVWPYSLSAKTASTIWNTKPTLVSTIYNR